MNGWVWPSGLRLDGSPIVHLHLRNGVSVCGRLALAGHDDVTMLYLDEDTGAWVAYDRAEGAWVEQPVRLCKHCRGGAERLAAQMARIVAAP